MYRDAYQRGLLTIFFSCGSKPLNIWETFTRDGYISKFLDEDIKSTVLEIGGTNVSTTYMVCPKGKEVLGITMPFLVMIVKNLKKYFSFEVTVLDDTGTRRRFRVSNFQSTTQILPLCTVMPIALSEGWNQIQFNMSDFCRRAYKKQFVEVQKFKINANIRIRRIYFADRILPEDQLPAEYKLYIPLKQKPGVHAKDEPKTEEVIVPPEKEKSAELKKRDSKVASASQVTKVASVSKTVSQVQDFEKRSSKVLEGEQVTTKTEAEAPNVPVSSVQGDAVTASTEEPVVVAEKGPDQSDAATEEPVAAAEGSPDQSKVPTEEPVTVEAESDAVAAEPVTMAEEPVAEVPGKNDADTQTAVEETQTEPAEPVREKSVEATTQTESPTTQEAAEDAVAQSDA